MVPSHWDTLLLDLNLTLVTRNKFISNFQTITCGVSQRSVLGPPLFLIYVNKIHVSGSMVKYHRYADEIFHSSKQLSTLKKDLNIALENVAN